MRISRTVPLCVSMAFAALLLVPAIGTAQRTSVARDYPIYNNGGKPDIVMDPQRFTSQMEIVDRYFAPTECAIAEGVVGGAGYRRVARRASSGAFGRSGPATGCRGSRSAA